MSVVQYHKMRSYHKQTETMQGVKTYSFSTSSFHQVDKGHVEAGHAEHVADANEEEHRVFEQRVVQHRGKHRLD